MEPYAHSSDHLLAELERIDLLIRSRVAHLRRAHSEDEHFQGLYISEQEVDALLVRPLGEPQWLHGPGRGQLTNVDSALHELAQTIACRRAASAERGIDLRLDRLARTFRLDAYDVDVLLVCLAVSRGVERALVSCDLPDAQVDSARRAVAEGGASLVKVGGAPRVAAIAAAGIPVFASLAGDGDPVDEARRLEAAGASLLDFRHSGAENGRRVVEAVSIPVLGGLGGGPWLDGRMRAAHRLLEDEVDRYVEDVRSGRQVKGD